MYKNQICKRFMNKGKIRIIIVNVVNWHCPEVTRIFRTSMWLQLRNINSIYSRPSKCLNHYEQWLCKIFLASTNLLLQTHSVLLYINFWSHFHTIFVSNFKEMKSNRYLQVLMVYLQGIIMIFYWHWDILKVWFTLLFFVTNFHNLVQFGYN